MYRGHVRVAGLASFCMQRYPMGECMYMHFKIAFTCVYAHFICICILTYMSYFWNGHVGMVMEQCKPPKIYIHTYIHRCTDSGMDVEQRNPPKIYMHTYTHIHTYIHTYIDVQTLECT